MKIRRRKIIKACKGTISIFLCIILCPIMTLIGVLIQYSNLHDSAQISREAMNVSTTAVLGNYDKYLEDRFGLMAISQDNTSGDTFNALFKNYYEKNIKTLNNNILVSNVNAQGKYSLDDKDVLKQQIMDISETTTLVEVFLDDLNVQELLDKLKEIEFITEIADTTKNLKDLTSEVKNLVKKAKNFKDKITNLKEQCSNLNSKIAAFKNSVTAINDKLSTSNITWGYEKDSDGNDHVVILFDGSKLDTEDEDVNYTQLLMDSSLKVFKDYKESIKDVIEKAKELGNAAKGVKGAFDGIPAAFDELKSAYGKAEQALKKFTSSEEPGKADGGAEEITEASVGVLKSIIDELSAAAGEAGDKFVDEILEAAKTSIDNVTSSIEADLKVGTALENWDDQAKKELVMSILQGNISGYVTSQMTTLISNVENIFESVDNAIMKAEDNFKDSVKGAVTELLQSLVSAVNSLFNLQVFYDGSLNANVNNLMLGGEDDNPYSAVLNAIRDMFNATNDFIDSIKSFNFWKALNSLEEFFTSIGDLIKELVNIVIEKVNSLTGLVADLTKGKNGLIEIYNKVLTCGYAVHNLPNRTNYDDPKAGLLFDYTKIGLKEAKSGVAVYDHSIGGLASLFDTTPGGGDDTMFCGCELEYIMTGTTSEIFNQAAVFMDIYFLRMVFDLVAVFKDKGVSAMAAAATIASWAVYVIVILAEPLVDTILLVNGAKIDLIKGSCYLSPLGITKLITKLSDLAISNEKLKKELQNSVGSNLEDKMKKYSGKIDGKYESGSFETDYDTHCLLIMFLQTTQDRLFERLTNIINMEAKNYYGAGKFDVSKAFTAVYVSADVEYTPFMSFITLGENKKISKNLEICRGY